MTQLEKRNLERYKIAVDIALRSQESKDKLGFDDSITYAADKYGMTKPLIYQYRKAAKFINKDTCNCIFDNRFKITQLVELNGLWIPTAQELYQKGLITSYMSCLELRDIARSYKQKQEQNKQNYL